MSSQTTSINWFYKEMFVVEITIDQIFEGVYPEKNRFVFFAFAIKKLLHFLFRRQGMSISTTFPLLTVEKTLSNHQFPIHILPESSREGP